MKNKQNVNKLITPIKSVITSSAQHTKPLHLDSVSEVLSNRLSDWLNNDKVYPITVHMLTSLLFNCGVRISEGLSICNKDVMADGSIVIRTKKGGENRIVRDVRYAKEWSKMSGTNYNPLINYSRFYMYRVMKKIGLSIIKEGNKVASVTHSGRHIYAHKLKSEGCNDQIISRQLGHKSIKNVKFYIRNHEKIC